MSVPNHEHVVDAVYARGGWNLTTKTGCGKFREACAWALHQVDANWGDLKKKASQNNYKGRAVDAVLWKPTGQSVDIIIASESAKARPGWTVDIPRYTDSDWLVPVEVSQPEPDPEPEPDPIPPPVPPQPPTPPRPPYPEMAALAVEIGQILDTPGSPYVGNLPAACEVVMFHAHKVLFGGWSLDRARQDARERAGG